MKIKDISQQISKRFYDVTRDKCC